MTSFDNTDQLDTGSASDEPAADEPAADAAAIDAPSDEAAPSDEPTTDEVVVDPETGELLAPAAGAPADQADEVIDAEALIEEPVVIDSQADLSDRWFVVHT